MPNFDWDCMQVAGFSTSCENPYVNFILLHSYSIICNLSLSPCTLVLFVVVQTEIMQNGIILFKTLLSVWCCYLPSHIWETWRYQSVLKPLMFLFLSRLLGIFWHILWCFYRSDRLSFPVALPLCWSTARGGALQGSLCSSGWGSTDQSQSWQCWPK